MLKALRLSSNKRMRTSCPPGPLVQGGLVGRHPLDMMDISLYRRILMFHLINFEIAAS